MSSVLKAAWRVVVRRAIADKAILAAGFSTVLLAITLIAVGPIYADAVTVSSLRRTLIDAPVTQSNLAITTRIEPATFERTDDQVLDTISHLFETVGGDIYRRGSSDSFSIAGLPGDHAKDLVIFRFFSDFESRAELLSGSWPQESDGLVQVAISQQVSSALTIGVGDVFEAIGRRQGSATHHVEVAGIYRVKDATDPYWFEDQMDLTGISPSTSFTTYGPLIVSREDFFGQIATGTSSLRWTVYPNHAQIGAEDIEIIMGRFNSLDASLNGGRAVGNRMQIESGLASVLRDTQRSLLVTRSAVVILTIQLAVLAGYSLILAAGLLSDTREVETSTLRARGASASQLLGMSAMEGLLITLPALAGGPPLAAWALRSFNRVGPLAGIGLTIAPTVTAVSWVLAAIAASGCLVALVVPAYRSARRSGNLRAARSRQNATSAARRAGADLALLVVAGVGLWQLARYGAPITRNVRGRLGIDPLLVAAPALALLAGAVLALRALPLMAGLADGLVGRGRKLVANLGISHLSRQPKRYSRSALMLMLSVAVGVFALSYASTWRTSQAERADFATGADILVSPSRRADNSIPDYVLSDAYSRIDGVRLPVPVVRIPAGIPSASKPIEYLLTDPQRAIGAMAFRSDQASQPISDLLDLLTSSRPTASSPPVEGMPTSVALTASMTVSPLPDLPYEPPLSDYAFQPSIRAVFTDAYGIPFRVDLGLLDSTGQSVKLTGSLQYRVGDRIFLPSYPLHITGLEIRGLTPIDPYLREAEVIIGDLEFSDDGSTWKPFALPDPISMDTSISQVRLAAETPTIVLRKGAGGTLVADLETGTTLSRPTRPAGYYMIWFTSPPDVANIDVLASSSLMEELRLHVGDSVPLGGLTGFTGKGKIVGEFATFPTVNPDAKYAVVADYATFLAATFGPGVFPREPDDYWLTARESSLDDVARQLRNAPYSSSSVVTRAEALTKLALDPVSLGTMGSLIMGLIAASALAAIGFIVNVVVTTRERSGHFALMRAVGMSTRQLLYWVGIENGITVGFALIIGTGLGLLLSNIVLPLTAVTQQGTKVVPDLIVIHPWGSIALLNAGLLVVLGVAVTMAARILNRLDLATLLREGEE